MTSRYEVLRPIARGGMAEILLARSVGIEGFEKRVVIKRILPELARKPEFVRMFLDEARLAASLHHSNIAQVYDIGEENGLYFLAMEYLQGEDVAELLTRLAALGRQPPIEVAVTVALGAAAGLHYAHEQASADGRPMLLVHRDISPHNIFVTVDGGVKLLDFGIAKAADRRAETRAGTIKGKLSYMSPEQVQGQPLDRRADIFSLGVVLWELSTGAKLFNAEGDFDTLKLIVERDAPAPSTVRADIPHELERIILKALHRRTDQRYQTAQQMQVELEAFGRNSGLAVSPLSIVALMAELLSAPNQPELGDPEDVTEEVGMTEALRRIRRTLVASPAPVPAPVQKRPTRALQFAEDDQALPRASDFPAAGHKSMGRRWLRAGGAIAVLAATAAGVWFNGQLSKQGDPPKVVEILPISHATVVPSTEPLGTPASSVTAPMPRPVDPLTMPAVKGSRRANRKPGVPKTTASKPAPAVDPDAPLPP
jgi:serine/threonine protein kinase